MFCYVQAYGVQMNGYVERDGQKLLWIGKRSQVKHTYPGMLDQLVAGGLVCNDQIMIKNLRRVEIWGFLPCYKILEVIYLVCRSNLIEQSNLCPILNKNNKPYSSYDHAITKAYSPVHIMLIMILSPPLISYFHDGNGSLMGLLVGRILWRNVKRKQEYPDPFLMSKFSFSIYLLFHVTLLWQMPLTENGFSLSHTHTDEIEMLLLQGHTSRRCFLYGHWWLQI